MIFNRAIYLSIYLSIFLYVADYKWQLKFLEDMITIQFDYIMLGKLSKVRMHYTPWITAEFKSHFPRKSKSQDTHEKDEFFSFRKNIPFSNLIEEK